MSRDETLAASAARALDVGRPTWGREIRQTLILASPIAAALLAEMGMGVIDNAMAGHLGETALAAAGLGLQLLFTPLMWGMGAVSATGAVGAQAHGADDTAGVSLAMRQGFLMATILSLPIIAILLGAWLLLPYVYDDTELVRQMRGVLLWGLPWVPLTYWFTVLRNFVTVMGRPMIVTVCAVLGLPLSFLFNYMFMYGNWGMPEMGAIAVGLSGSLVAVFHLVLIVAYVEWVPQLRHYRVFADLMRLDRKMMRELFQVGVPIALSYLFESGMFFLSAALMGIIATATLAGHNAVINICSVSFMIPYAFSQAATVRVGYAVGAGRLEAARMAGYVAIGLGVCWMLIAALTMWTAPSLLVAIYLDLDDPLNAEAVRMAVTFFTVAAIFQVVDGLQVSTQGALRGLKDTKVPMIICGLGYWVFGLGTGIPLAFWFDLGGVGLWWGLAIGLTVSATLLVLRWRHMSARLVA
jgi:MATE family multidrug resistance protein